MEFIVGLGLLFIIALLFHFFVNILFDDVIPDERNEVKAILEKKEKQRKTSYNVALNLSQSSTQYVLTFKYKDLYCKINDSQLYHLLNEGQEINAFLNIKKDKNGEIKRQWLSLE